MSDDLHMSKSFETPKANLMPVGMYASPQPEEIDFSSYTMVQPGDNHHQAVADAMTELMKSICTSAEAATHSLGLLSPVSHSIFVLNGTIHASVMREVYWIK